MPASTTDTRFEDEPKVDPTAGSEQATGTATLKDRPTAVAGLVGESEPTASEAQGQAKGPKRRGPSEIVIYRDWCKACGICVEFCPTKVFDVGDGGEPVIARPAKCISCDLCELLCPDFAITLHRLEEGKEAG